jgi:hypothetical protein
MIAEAGVLIDIHNEPIYWHLPNGRSQCHLPDSHELWNMIWENRHIVRGFAHSHPGSGSPLPSDTDITTFKAIESGLGKRLRWWITSDDSLAILEWEGPNPYDYKVFHPQPYNTYPHPWLEKLRFCTRHYKSNSISFKGDNIWKTQSTK